jgi:hypothetical protein
MDTDDATEILPRSISEAEKVIRALGECDEPEKEYWTHVSAQEELPLAGDIAPVQPPRLLDRLLTNLSTDASEHDTEVAVASELLRDPELLDELRLLVSVSDKRCYLDLSYIFSRTYAPGGEDRTLCGCRPGGLTRHSLTFFRNILRRTGDQTDRAATASRVIASYLVEMKGLATILSVYGGLTAAQRSAVIQRLGFLPRPIA